MPSNDSQQQKKTISMAERIMKKYWKYKIPVFGAEYVVETSPALVELVKTHLEPMSSQLRGHLQNFHGVDHENLEENLLGGLVAEAYWQQETNEFLPSAPLLGTREPGPPVSPPQYWHGVNPCVKLWRVETKTDAKRA